MNPLTQVKRTQVINRKEAALGIADEASWHAKYKDSAYVFVGGVPFDLTEGDLLAVFAQYGEVVDVNLVRDKATGKSRGFAFVAYEDQRSTILAVDNLNGAKILGRIIRVDHVSKYKKKEEVDEEEEQQKREARGVCYAFQKGECNRGASCKFSHDEQRNSNTGWGSKEESNGRWGHDRYCGPPKSHKNFPSTTTEQRIPDRTKELRSVEREGRSLRSEAYGGRDSSMRPGDGSMKDEDRYGCDRSPERSRSERRRNDDQYGRDRSPERSRSERRRNDDQYGHNRSPERLRSERHDSEAKHDDDHKWPRHDRDSSSRYRRGDEDAEELRRRSKR